MHMFNNLDYLQPLISLKILLLFDYNIRFHRLYSYNLSLKLRTYLNKLNINIQFHLF